jgi:hypothetical protein
LPLGRVGWEESDRESATSGKERRDDTGLHSCRLLLDSPRASALNRRFASGAPVTDWHSHLPAALIASNHRFAALTEAWMAHGTVDTITD